MAGRRKKIAAGVTVAIAVTAFLLLWQPTRGPEEGIRAQIYLDGRALLRELYLDSRNRVGFVPAFDSKRPESWPDHWDRTGLRALQSRSWRYFVPSRIAGRTWSEVGPGTVVVEATDVPRVGDQTVLSGRLFVGE